MITIEQFKSLEDHNFELQQIDRTYIVARYREFLIHISTNNKVICFFCENHGHNVGVEEIDINPDEIESAIKNCIENFDL